MATDDKREIKDCGLFFSKLYNVVKSKDFANLRPEDGDGGDTWTYSEDKLERSRKMTLAQTGRKWSKEQKDKFCSIRQNSYLSYSGNDTKNNSTFLGKTHKDSSKKMCSISNRKENAKKRIVRTNFKRDEDFRKKCSLSNLGKPKNLEHRKKLSENQKGKVPGNAKPVIINDLEFSSMQSAAKFLNIPYSTLRNRLKSKNIYYKDINLK